MAGYHVIEARGDSLRNNMIHDLEAKCIFMHQLSNDLPDLIQQAGSAAVSEEIIKIVCFTRSLDIVREAYYRMSKAQQEQLDSDPIIRDLFDKLNTPALQDAKRRNQLRNWLERISKEGNSASKLSYQDKQAINTATHFDQVKSLVPKKVADKCNGFFEVASVLHLLKSCYLKLRVHESSIENAVQALVERYNTLVEEYPCLWDVPELFVQVMVSIGYTIPGVTSGDMQQHGAESLPEVGLLYAQLRSPPTQCV